MSTMSKNSASMAGPPSPETPFFPLPATMRKRPVGKMHRTAPGRRRRLESAAECDGERAGHPEVGVGALGSAGLNVATWRRGAGGT